MTHKVLALVLLAGCGGAPMQGPADPSTLDPSTPDPSALAPITSAATPPTVPPLTFCQVSDPANLAAAFTVTSGSDWKSYACKVVCADPTTCEFDVVTPQGPVLSKRGDVPMRGLAFVVDEMGGHIVFTPDGDDVVVTHGGAGATDLVHPFDVNLQLHSNAKTVAVSWEQGVDDVFSGAGWHTRKDAQPSSLREHGARPAAVIAWVKASFAAGKKLGTVGSSLGCVATLGARIWYGLDPIIDYQMFIGGPANWDISAGCGRVHYATGHCDVDAAACAGNPFSSYGDDDPLCPGADSTNDCRVPTIMAFGTWDHLINYTGVTTTCAATSDEEPDATLDVSSAKDSGSTFTFHGPTDFVMNEGAVQGMGFPADQGMGEGQAAALYTAIASTKGWIDNQGHSHGDAWDKVPALMADAAKHVIAGMGL